MNMRKRELLDARKIYALLNIRTGMKAKFMRG